MSGRRRRRRAVGLEMARRQAVLLHQAVKLGAVAVGEPGSVGDVAVGQFQQADEVIALEALLGFGTLGERSARCTSASGIKGVVESAQTCSTTL